jgi:hypothetical protein
MQNEISEDEYNTTLTSLALLQVKAQAHSHATIFETFRLRRLRFQKQITDLHFYVNLELFRNENILLKVSSTQEWNLEKKILSIWQKKART